MATNRPERVGEAIRDELSQLMAREVRDPGVGFITLTQVKVSPDLQLARVYYTSMGDPKARRETEKALERALSAAEELDIVILLDEGDALMARRTDVGNANDRYANLETNFLLQRIESFGGILLVTSNDAERIDPAFARRMDSAITLRPPDQVRREAILASHLGADARVSAGLVRDIACRCVLTGGQIRNIALHARLLGLEAGDRVGDRELRSSLEREYRKLGSPCPLRGSRTGRTLAAVG